MKEQLQFICLNELEKELILIAIKTYIGKMDDIHKKSDEEFKPLLARHAECYARVMGVPVHDNWKLNEAHRTRITAYSDNPIRKYTWDK